MTYDDADPKNRQRTKLIGRELKHMHNRIIITVIIMLRESRSWYQKHTLSVTMLTKVSHYELIRSNSQKPIAMLLAIRPIQAE